MTSENDNSCWYLLIFAIAAHILVFFLSPAKSYEAMNLFFKIIASIAPSLLLVFIFMALMNYYVKPKDLAKYMGKNSGAMGWVIAIVAGVLSTGPIYLWYPLLNDLQKQGVKSGLLAAFLYNRAVKIPLVPLMAFYFGFAYVFILSITMVAVSVFQGLATEKIMKAIK